MKKENLGEANELSKNIKEIEMRIEQWEAATDFNNNTIQVKTSGYSSSARIIGIPFEVLKAISIFTYEKQLQELNNKLENLP